MKDVAGSYTFLDAGACEVQLYGQPQTLPEGPYDTVREGGRQIRGEGRILDADT